MNWLALSISSGLCAALNGLFAKLVTTTGTSGLVERIEGALGIEKGGWVVEGGVRGGFFVLNLVFNAVMWAMFTAALTSGSSATKVSVINTSSNFMLTALLGWLIFAERLPPLWFLGAALLIGGSVIIGRRDSGAEKKDGYVAVSQQEEGGSDEAEEEGSGEELESLGGSEGERARGRDGGQGRRDFGSDTEGSRAGWSGRETPGTTGDERESETSEGESAEGSEGE